MLLRPFLLILALLCLPPLGARLCAAEAADPFASIEVPPCKTSITLGKVTMTLGTFLRTPGGYEASYQAKVVPFFFFSERGRLRIDADEALIQRLKKGESISFTGLATTSNGHKRKVEGQAWPESTLTGRLKIKVIVSRAIRLSFPGSYRFGSSTTSTSPSSR